jgi:murein DD-endopeptidase MepM/ murein hydrolase activator NlpD
VLALIASVCLVLPSGARIVDPFRAPECERCAGNRGIEYSVVAGAPVVSGLRGSVTFAGRVAGRNYVVVRADADGRVRVTYGGLAIVSVARGDLLRTGDVLGTASATLHVGVRVGESYVDPRGVSGGASRGVSGGAMPHSAARPRFRVTLGTVPVSVPVPAPACAR